MLKTRRSTKILALVLVLMFAFSSTVMAANPDKIYATDADKNNLEFQFNELLDAYGEETADYIQLWEDSNKIALVFGDKVLSFADFLNKFADDIVTTPEEYSNLTDAEVVAAPENVRPVNADGTLGEEIVDPDPVGDLVVEAVSAINAKALEVTFNKEVDTSKVTFDVKRGTTAVSGLTATWNEAKTVATLTSSVNLAAGDYTITATGVDFAEGKNTATVKVEAQKVSKIEFVSTDLLKKSTPKDEATFSYKVTDQYGTDITKTVADNDISKSVVIGATTGTLTLDPTKGIATVKKTGGNFADTDKTAVITLVHGATGTTVSATMNIVASATVESLTFGENILPKGKTNIETGLAEAVKVPVTVKDQYGNTLKDLATLNSAVSLVSSNAAKFKFDADADGNTFVVMDTTLLNDKGTVVLTAVNPSTGKSFTKSFDVVKPAAANKIVVGDFQSAVVANGDKDLGLSITVYDQFENELNKDQIAKNASVINPWISGDNTKLGGLTVDTDKNSKTYGMLKSGTVASGVTVDAPAVLVFNAPGGVVTKTITIKPARVSATVEKIDSTTLLQGATKELKFAFKDQYGETQKAPVDNPKLKYSIEFKKLSGDDNALTLISVNGTPKTLTAGKYEGIAISDLAKFEVQAASDKTGVYQVTVNLIDTTSSLAVSSASTAITVAKSNVEGLTYSVADIPTLNGSADNTANITNDATRSVYAQKIVVDATDANGNKYVINKNDIISVTSNNAKFVAGQGATSKDWFVASDKLTLPTDKDTATLTIKLNTLDGIKTFTKDVKASTAAPVIQELKLVKSALAAPTANDKTVNDNVAGSTFEFTTKEAAIDTGLAIYVAGKDQYGVWSPVTVDGTTNKIIVNSTDLATASAFSVATNMLKLDAAKNATAQKDIKATILAGNATAEIVISIAAADTITGVPAAPVDATFTATSNFKHTLVVANIDMDPNTSDIQDNVTINGVKYTVTVDGAGKATVAATGTATETTTTATTSPIVITVKDGKVNATETVTLNLAAVTAGSAPTITITK